MCDKPNCDHFTHLHVHSEYSTLDGMSKVKELITTAKELGQSAIAITDHGSTSALWEAQKYGDEYGVKVIHGSEFYYERETDGENGHLLILAKSDKGLQNILRLQEIGYVNHFHKKPRISWDYLKQHSEDLIITSTCLGSAFNQYLLKGDHLGALNWARKYKDMLGDDFYIELQPNSLPEQHVANMGSIRIARQLGIKMVATNDVHYTFESDCFPHEVLLALQTNKKMSDEKRFRFTTNDFWLKSYDEMRSTFTGIDDAVVAEALSTTKEIEAKCNARIYKGNYLPKFYNIPEGKTERNLLVEKVMDGARQKSFVKDREYMQDVQGEIDVIDRNGYCGYFLIVQDYINTARNSGIIVGDGRGSGAGSKVAHLTDISKIEPRTFGLLFERFMADGRQPDFDVDFSDQDAVFTDLQRKYGVENVARIVAFGKMTPKAVIRKVFNAFEHPNALQNHLSKLVSDESSIAEAIANSPELAEYAKKYKTEFDVIERLEGVISHESQHAGGVIIYPDLSSILPIKTKGENRQNRIVAFDKYMLEELGHYKFDILGLETLPIIRRTLDSIKLHTGIEIDLDTIDYDDPKVYNMLCDGHVSGVFQLNNQSQKIMEQQPRNFRDLIAINALIRPGVGDWNEYIARRKGKHFFQDPKRPWMHETLMTMTYQEQFLLDANQLCGWDIAYADKNIRKGKNLASDEVKREKFINDGILRGHEHDYMMEVWNQIIEAQGDYSFNKSHAGSYARTSFQTAFLKCYYPTHFYASLMSSEKTDGEGQVEIAKYFAECKARGIKILPPDINQSGEEFIVSESGITYRITTIKHVGESAIEEIHAMRPIKSFADFLERRDKSVIKQNVIVNLIKAGCFDFDNPDRSEHLWQLDMSNRKKTQIKNNYLCPEYEWSDKIKMQWEKEVLGMYLTAHPMERYGFKPLDTFKDASPCLQGGEVYEIKEFQDRNKNYMAFVWINTLFGNVKLVVFASTWGRIDNKNALTLGNTVLVRGKRSGNDMILDSAEVLT